MAAIRRLPERQRQVIALRLFLDLDTAGTAEVLGIAPGTVTAHLARRSRRYAGNWQPRRKERTARGAGMNDTDLLTTVKDSFAEVRADTPLTAIERRGRAVRARRRGLAGAAAAAAAVVTLVLAQRPGTGTRSGPAPGTHLAAWTVTEKPPGIIEIKIRELKDPADMRRELRSDGVPAFVRFQNQNPPDCLNYPLSPARG